MLHHYLLSLGISIENSKFSWSKNTWCGGGFIFSFEWMHANKKWKASKCGSRDVSKYLAIRTQIERTTSIALAVVCLFLPLALQTTNCTAFSSFFSSVFVEESCTLSSIQYCPISPLRSRYSFIFLVRVWV